MASEVSVLAKDGGGDGRLLGTAREAKIARRREIQKENMAECRSLVMFMLFLCVFTTAMLLDQSASSSRVADHIRAKILGGPVLLDSISTLDEAYEYVAQVIVPTFTENNTDTNSALEVSSFYHPIDVANRMVGGIRLRQARSKLDPNCQMGPIFAEWTVSCYPPYFFLTSETGPYGPDDRFTWSRDEAGSPHSGEMGMYTPHGYMEVLPNDRVKALAALAKLKEDEFLGPWTRGLFIDFVIWSSNIGTYVVTTICIEFSASGGVATYDSLLTMTQRALSPGGLGSDADKAALGCLVIVSLFVVWFMTEEVIEVKKGGTAYWFDLWNVLDWFNNLTIVSTIALRAMTFAKGSTLNIGMAQLNDNDEFVSLRALAKNVEMVSLLNSINAVLLWTKVVKYLQHIPLIKDLIRTVWRAFDLFLPFLFMISLALVGFVMAYNVGFGDRIYELSSFSSGVVYLARSFVRDVTLLPAYSITHVFGAIMVLIFYITFLLIGVNMHLAIMVDAMFRSKHEGDKDAEEGSEKEPVEEFIRVIQSMVRGVIKRNAPRLYKKLYRKKKRRGKGAVDDLMDDPVPDNDMKQIAANADDDDDNESVNSFPDDSRQSNLPSKQELFRSIGYMVGSVLGEMSSVGVEIKSELHDVCERIAQMQMAVEELSMRADAVRLDQEEYMAANM